MSTINSIPVFIKRGLKEKLVIEKTPLSQGTLYFTEDTNEIFYDDESERFQIINTDAVQFLIEESINIEFSADANTDKYFILNKSKLNVDRLINKKE